MPRPAEVPLATARPARLRDPRFLTDQTLPFPLPPDKLAEAEQALGVRLPSRYAARMLRENGGEIDLDGDDWRLFPLRDNSDRKRLARTANHVGVETRQFREWRGFPPQAIAIATDDRGNALVLLPRPDDPAALADDVFRWDHETGTVSKVRDAVFAAG